MNKQPTDFTKIQQEIVYNYVLCHYLSKIDNTMALWEELQHKNIHHPRDWVGSTTLQHGKVLEKYLNMYIDELYRLIISHINNIKIRG